jgi:aminoglycoside 6'-N-acetyltransferase
MITHRLANSDDAKLLREWDKRPHLQLSSNPESDWEYEKQLELNPDWRDWWMAELNGKPFGFMQIMICGADPEDYWEWGPAPRTAKAIDIWIGEENLLGQGLGTHMMAFAVKNCFSDPLIETILIDPLNSNTRAHKFYEKCGFSFLEYRTFGTDHCKIYKMKRADWRYGDTP